MSSEIDQSPTSDRRTFQLALFWKTVAYALVLLAGHFATPVLAIILASVVRVSPTLLEPVLSAMLVLATTALFLRYLDHKPIRALGIGFDRPWFRHLLLGLFLGVFLVSLVWAVFVAAGLASWTANKSITQATPKLVAGGVFSLAVALYLETLFRGYVFQILARWNQLPAILITGIGYVFIQALQTNSLTPIAAVNTFLAHLLFVVCFLRTRSLWLGVGVHFAWNYALGFVFGMPIGGRVAGASLFKTDMMQSVWTGGSQGPMAGLAMTLLLACSTTALWRLLQQHHPKPSLLDRDEDAVVGKPANALVGSTSSLFRPAIGPQSSRIQAIDVLRGLAICGILPLNMQMFALHDAAVLNPYACEWTDSLNVGVWVALNTLFGRKDLMLFSMLFGAGILMVTDRFDESRRSAIPIQLQRMTALMLIGLIHAYVLWPGDILFTYAICGLLVFWFRRLRAIQLLWIGFGFYAVPMLFIVAGHFAFPFFPESLQTSIVASFNPSIEAILEYYETYRGSWIQQMPSRAGVAMTEQTLVFVMAMGWVAAGMMLVGMGLYRLGYMTGERARGSYVRLLVFASVAGTALLTLGFYINFQQDWRPEFSFFLGRLPGELASPIMALAWIAVVMLLCRKGTQNWLASGLASVGRMSLTNYLMHTVFCSLIFYGDGFGMIGRLDRVEQLLVSISIWIFQLVCSPLWLRYYRFGPVEWLWRSMAYAQFQPMRNSVSVEAGVRR